MGRRMRVCLVCGRDIGEKRRDAKTCSVRCRKRMQRNLAKCDMNNRRNEKLLNAVTHEKQLDVVTVKNLAKCDNLPGAHFRLLDLCCKSGGASVGYTLAGFQVVGVDIEPQPDYPFEFIQADVLTLDYEFLLSFDAIHASPPCQAYSKSSAIWRKRGKQYPDLYLPVKRLLVASGKPYIIENVPGSPVKGIRLYGDMFGLRVLRERIFESNIPLRCDLPRYRVGSVKTGEYVTVAGRNHSYTRWHDAMGIHWTDIDGVRQAIPPSYTEYLGEQLFGWLLDRVGCNDGL